MRLDIDYIEYIASITCIVLLSCAGLYAGYVGMKGNHADALKLMQFKTECQQFIKDNALNNVYKASTFLKGCDKE